MHQNTKRKIRAAMAYVHLLPPLFMVASVGLPPSEWVIVLVMWVLAAIVAGWNANACDRAQEAAWRAHQVAFQQDARLLKAAKIFENIQWRSGEHCDECPFCRHPRDMGHAPWCAVGRFIEQEGLPAEPEKEER